MKKLSKKDLKDFLDEKAEFYENPEFIETDPIQIPHLYTLKQDIEIAGFLTATISWGNRKSILNNAHKLMNLLGNSPYDFVMSHHDDHLEELSSFVHRTFNGEDLKYFIKALNHLYKNYEDMEQFYLQFKNDTHLQHAIHSFKKQFFCSPIYPEHKNMLVTL